MPEVDDNFDTSFQSTSKKLVLPSTSDKPQYDFYSNDEARISEFSTDELVRLLAFMEGELEAREDVIEHLRRERTKILLAEAKYGKLSANDPFAALRRDSATTDEMFDEDQIAQMYESQVDQLEKLIAVQKKSQRNASSLLTQLDKKHYRLMKKLEADRMAKIQYAKQGDDLVAMLEKDRSHLNQQIEYHIEEKRKVEIERDKIEMKLGAEKKKHEAIVMYLIQERKQMLLKMHELRVNAEQLLQQQQKKAGSSSCAPSSSASINDRELIEELKKEVTFLRGERESLTKTHKMMKNENLSLKETIRGQETDLMLLRKNLVSGSSKFSMDKISTMLPQLAPDGGSLIVANRSATTSSVRSSVSSSMASSSASTSSPSSSMQNNTVPSRLPSSSSFPVEKSRLPRAPSTPSPTVPRTSLGPVPVLSAPRTMSSPSKKTPMMGVSSSTARRPQSSTANLPAQPHISVITNSAAMLPLAPELEQLEAAIQSMNVVNTSRTNATSSAISKRSSSLPREREQNNNPTGRKSVTMTSSNKNGMNSSTTAIITTRIAGPSSSSASERKLSGTVKRNGILAKAFGSSK